jgi:RimJ/RimL family protein N-acetyltransferase
MRSWSACMRPCSSSRKPFGIAKRDPSLREATGPEHHRRVTRYCFAEADVDRLLALYNDLEVMRFINGGKPTSREEVEREYREAAQQQLFGLQEDAHFLLHLRPRKRGQHSQG